VSDEDRARAAYEAELSRISSADMMLQAAVSLLNIGARRLGGGEEEAGASASGGAQEAGAAGGAPTRDLEQVRDAIDAVRALLDILERRIPEGLRPLRDALAQLQVAYAREVTAEGAEAAAAPQQAAEGAADPGPARSDAQEEQAGESPPEGERRGPGPAEASGRLWVPGR
jgi:hypothetical protein